jgi:hypothetical protein
MTCTCGHVYDEHGGNSEYPGSSACNVDDCDCACFEACNDYDDDGDEDGDDE